MSRVLAGMIGVIATLVAAASPATAEVVAYADGGLSFTRGGDWTISIGVSNHGSWLWQRGGTGEAIVPTQSVTTRFVVDFAFDGPAEHDHILVVDDLTGNPAASSVRSSSRSSPVSPDRSSSCASRSRASPSC